MNGSIVRQLIAKDLFLLRPMMIGALVFGGIGIGLMTLGETQFFVGWIILFIAATLLGIFTTAVASVYPHYIAKADKKGRTRAEVDAIIRWLTGYTPNALEKHLTKRTDFETFFKGATGMNPKRRFIRRDSRRAYRRDQGNDDAGESA